MSAAIPLPKLPRVHVLPEPQSLALKVIRDEPAFDSLEPEWNRLAEEAALEHPFLTFDWIRTWWDCFGTENQLYIIAVNEGERMIAVAPLMLASRTVFGLPLRSLEFIGNVHTPRSDFLISGRHADVYSVLWRHLLEEKNLWDMLMLCQLPEKSSTLKELPRHARASNFHVGYWRSDYSPFIRLQGNWEQYVSSLRRKHRANVRRRTRQLADLGQISLEILSQPGERGALEEGFGLEAAAWKAAEGTAISCGTRVRRFYEQIAERFARRGWLQLLFLKVADKRIAFHYCVRYRRKSFLLKPGYDPNYARFSPSNILCAAYLERAFDSGFLEYDFLGAEEGWKMQWARESRAHYWLFIFPRGFIPSLVYGLKFRFIPRLQKNPVYPFLRGACVRFREFLARMFR